MGWDSGIVGSMQTGHAVAGGASGPFWTSDSANLATSLQMKISAMTAKVLGSRTGYSAPKRTRRSVFLQNEHLTRAGSGGGSAMISGFSSSGVSRNAASSLRA